MRNIITNVRAKFNCNRLRIDKALGIENLTTIIATKVVVGGYRTLRTLPAFYVQSRPPAFYVQFPQRHTVL